MPAVTRARGLPGSRGFRLDQAAMKVGTGLRKAAQGQDLPPTFKGWEQDSRASVIELSETFLSWGHRVGTQTLSLKKDSESYSASCGDQGHS